MNLDSPAFAFALALTAGACLQALARLVRVPGIILLMAGGVALGPSWLNVVRPGTLGHGLEAITGLALAVILFEGGLQLNARRLRRQARDVQRLITLGAAVTVALAALASGLFLGWSARTAFLFGTLVCVTGPTVVQPIVRAIRLRGKLRTILEAEGVLIDPIGAILAVVALEVALAGGEALGTARALGGELLGMVMRLGLGAVIGVAGGFAVGIVLRSRRALAHDLRNVFTLACALLLFAGANAILAESGIMAVAVAGLVVGNMPGLKSAELRELTEYKEELAALLVGLLFVILSATVNLADVRALGWQGLAVVAVLVFIARPVAVSLCTRGSPVTRPERAFLAWLAPRGIVAFAVTSLFAAELSAHGMEQEAVQLSAMVFLVIASTVVAQGLTAAPAASLLGVREPRNQGWALIGANAIARLLARSLEKDAPEAGRALLIDTNSGEIEIAQRNDLKAVHGNAGDARVLASAGIGSKRAVITLTPNAASNVLFADRISQDAHGPDYFAAVGLEGPVGPRDAHEVHAAVLFAAGIDHNWWAHTIRQGRAVTSVWTYKEPRGGTEESLSEALAPAASAGRLLPLVHRSRRWVGPASDARPLEAGDRLTLACHQDSTDEAEDALKGAGFIPWVEEAE